MALKLYSDTDVAALADVTRALCGTSATYTLAEMVEALRGLIPAEIINQLPIATDTDGSIYNGIGYLEKARFNSSGSIVSYTTSTADMFESVTGFIPVQNGDTIYFRNLYVPSSSNGFGGYEKYLLFDSSKNRLGIWQGSTHTSIFSNVVTENKPVGANSHPMISQATINYANTAYIRLAVFGVSGDSVITVNQNPD